MNGFIAVSGQWKKEKASTPGGDEASTVTKEASIGGGACGTDHFLLARGAVDVDTDDLGAVEGLFGVLQSDDLVVGAVLIDEELEGVHALLGGEATEGAAAQEDALVGRGEAGGDDARVADDGEGD